MKNIVKILYIFLGSLTLVIAVFGVVIPGLPVTPFLLLTAWFYVRSSEKLFKLLINNKFLGRYILKFKKDKGMSRRTKIYSISLMWFMILASTIFFIESLIVRIVVIGAGIAGTIVMGFIIKTVKISSES